jgi:Fic family protein
LGIFGYNRQKSDINVGKIVLDFSKMTITPEMLSLISEIDEFKGTWQSCGRLASERLHVLRKITILENIGSSARIEGSTLTDREVEHLLCNFKTDALVSQYEQEVAGYAHASEEIFQSFDSISTFLTENVIKHLHGWLHRYSPKDQRLKSENNMLHTDVTSEIPIKMKELVIWTRDQQEHKTIHPLIIIGIFVAVFHAIDPFKDDNGRLSRIMTSLLLLKAGYLYVPFGSLESIIERDKENYFFTLTQTKAALKVNSPDLTPWLIFFLRNLQKQKKLLEQKIANEKTLSLLLPELSNRILILIQEHGGLGISQIQKIIGANRNTLKKHLAELVRKGNLIRSGKGKATWYILP